MGETESTPGLWQHGAPPSFTNRPRAFPAAQQSLALHRGSPFPVLMSHKNHASAPGFNHRFLGPLFSCVHPAALPTRQRAPAGSLVKVRGLGLQKGSRS